VLFFAKQFKSKEDQKCKTLEMSQTKNLWENAITVL